MPTLPEERLAGGVPLLRRRGRRRPAHAHDRPHRGARPRRGGRQPRRASSGCSTTATARSARRDGRGRRASASRSGAARGRQRGRRVGRRRPRPRRGHAPRHDPPGQGHPHHRAVGEGAQRHRRRRARAEGQAVGVRRAVAAHRRRRRSSSPTSAPPTPTTTARSTTRSARPTTSPTCSSAINFSVREPLDRGRRGRHVGRAAAAREGGDQRAHRRPVAPPQGARCPAAAWSRSPAASSRPTARWPRTRSTRSSAHLDDLPRSARRCRTRRLRLLGADGGARPATSHATWPTGTAARRRVLHALVDADPVARRAAGAGPARTCGPRPSTPCATRWPRTVDDVLARRTRARLQARDASAAAAADVAALLAPSSAGPTPRPTGRSAAYVALVEAERSRARPAPHRRPPSAEPA